MVVSNIGYLLVASTAGYIAVRVFQGAVTAGLLPAAIAIVGDSVPERRRAQGTGLMMGAYGAGFIFGPVIGGALFDRWGFPAPFVTSAALALAAFVFATVMLRPGRSAGWPWPAQ